MPNSLSPLRFQTPVDRMTSAVNVQTTRVSMNGSSAGDDALADRLVGLGRGVSDRRGALTGLVGEQRPLHAEQEGVADGAAEEGAAALRLAIERGADDQREHRRDLRRR